MAAAIVGCNSRLPAPLDRHQRGQAAFVADLPERPHRIVLQRPFELGNLRDLVEGIRGLVRAERLDHRRAEEVDAAHHLTLQHDLHLRVLAVRGDGANQRRTHELGLLALERLSNRGTSNGSGWSST